MCGDSKSYLYLVYCGLFISLCFSLCDCAVPVHTDLLSWENRKMAIIGPGAPTPEFSSEFAFALRKTLTSAMDNITNDEPIPLLDEFKLTEQKYISLICLNKYSRLWLIDAVEKLSPFQGKSLLVVEEKDVPELHHFFVYLPYTDESDAAHILVRIKRSTPNLKTAYWKIRGIEADRGIEYKSKGSVLKIDIDTSSIRLIEEMNYSVYVGMGRAYFWDFENKKGHLQAESLRRRYW